MILGVLCLIAGSAHVATSETSPREGREKARLAPAQQSMMTRAAAARISEESRGVLPEPDIEAAPRSSATAAVSEQRGPGPTPSPPAGYSFVSYRGDMPRGRIESEMGAGGESPLPDLDWLGTETSIRMLSAQADAAGRDWSFGWIGLAAEATADDLMQALEGTGARVVGSSGALVRARLPGDVARLQAIAALPEVGGLGALPPERKLARELATPSPEASPGEATPVFITLMSGDPDSRWRQALEDLGAVVGRFDPRIRVYAANVPRARLEAIAAADFVLAVEPIGIFQSRLDTAVPAMGADALRRFDGVPGLFSGIGGASVPIGVMDTGLNINHPDIASNRESICGANFSLNLDFLGFGGTNESEDLWIDAGSHGTHVTGTILGNGYLEPRFAGMAPAVRHIRFAKVLNSSGLGFGDGIHRAMDFLARPTECAEAASPSLPVKPLVVNVSLGDSSRGFEGRGVEERKLDSIVWSQRQLYVVAQSNEGINGFSDFAAAKNSLAVGAVLDSGDIAAFSSHGPTFDGRLAPQVVATGVGIHSTRGGGSRGGYARTNGTSFSSPSVAGVAALLMDAVPAFREQPALARARLMAGAIRPDPWLEDAAAFPATNSDGPGTLHAQYGLGKVSARTGVLNRDRADGWSGAAAASELRAGQYAYQDILVPDGASRVDLVLTWDEPPTDNIGSAVLNDLDLWLDRDGDCAAVACGEHVSSSRLDNVEWIILRNPQPGLYRAKVAAHRIYTAPPRAALAWTVIRGASTPNLRISADSSALAGGQEQELTLTLSADAYVASGTRLHIDCRDTGGPSGCGQVRIHAVEVSREDGVTVDLSGELGAPEPDGPEPGMPAFPGQEAIEPSPVPLGSSIPIGEISVGESRETKLRVSYTGESNMARLYFTASAWNARASWASVGVGGGSRGPSGIAGRPPNDDFQAAASIEGPEGSLPLDLLLATPEPGEPLFTSRRGRPAGSVWYRWTAPAGGPVHFDIPPPAHPGDMRDDGIHVFRGDHIAALEEIASGQWGSTFFAEQGQTYRIRVSKDARGAALELRWARGSRPANDNLAEASPIEGPAGVVHGNNRGATLEPGEWFGFAAATTWYRWTAPGDGLWLFQSDAPRRVFVFEEGAPEAGVYERDLFPPDATATDSFSRLRLVSSFPVERSVVNAGAGREYLIAVAELTAYSSGGAYPLRWSPLPFVPRSPNDDIAGAEPIESVLSSEHLLEVDPLATVEPGEPAESGVRTKWWVWEAPADGRYTWSLTDPGGLSFSLFPTHSRLRVTVFTGSSVEDLQLVAESRMDADPSDFVFQAAAGQRYWIAAGFPTGDLSAYSIGGAAARIVWGPTPGNDRFTNAAPLVGAMGSMAGSNRFATMEPSERVGPLGHSSLWWTYEAPASGWYRFRIDEPFSPWVLAAYREAPGGFGPLELVRSSHPPEWSQSHAVEVVFFAQAGSRYRIRLGSRGEGSGGEFTLHWDESEAPVWLKYVGSLADGDLDAGGNPVALGDPASLALNTRGTLLYLASGLGLQVFERDPATGNLTLLQELANHDLGDSSLVWDARRDALYAHRCGAWRRFAPVDQTHRELRDEGMLSVTDLSGAANCSGDVFMDSGGSFIHTVDPMLGQLQVLAFDTPTDLRHVQTLAVPGLKRALLSNGGSHVYAATHTSILVFERDGETGALTQAGGAEPGLWNLESIAISSDDRYLFAFDNNGTRSNLFRLEDDPSSPRLVANLPPFWNQPLRYFGFDNRCGGIARRGAPAVDLFCKDSAFGVQWQPETGELAPTDFVAAWQPDRFNNPIPRFGHTRFFVASPDGRHAYLSTEGTGLLIFERVGVGADGFVRLQGL
ncbi:MAG: S8 family peptidase, partial [Acidobacteria bacterium]|nr:S8 family peptidase [Acidobacteriota bacterium]